MNLRKIYNEQGYIPSIFGIETRKANYLLSDFELNKKIAYKNHCIDLCLLL